MSDHRRKRGETRALVKRLAGRGMSGVDIAKQLGVSPPTVTMHMKRIKGDDWRDARRCRIPEGAKI